MIAEKYGQPPQDVAQWPGEWLAAAVTVMDAQAGAEHERQIREQRRARASGGRGH